MRHKQRAWGGRRHAWALSPAAVPGSPLTRTSQVPAVSVGKCRGMGPTLQSGQGCSTITEVLR